MSKVRVVILGGGFGGIAAARQLKDPDVEVVLIDQRNHHLFQPLLYQVATAALAPANIAMPIRRLFRRRRNVRVLLQTVTAIHPDRREVVADGTPLTYDYLVVATGARHSYFGHDAWEDHAPGLKSVEDALEIRRRFLIAFEEAEEEQDPARRRAILTFVVVGGGPTGVELAGSMAEIARFTIPEDFRSIDTSTARVILVEGTNRLLGAFAPASSERALRDLARLGVEVRLEQMVTDVKPWAVTLRAPDGQEELLPAHNVFWAAGVAASPLGRQLGEVDRAGRVKVGPDLTVPGHPEVFVVGDLAAAVSAKNGKPVPGVAQGAIQGGRYAGRVIANEIRAQRKGKRLGARKPFSYRDKGSMATIGRNKAVAEIGPLKLGGIIAWLLWALVHISFLIGFRNKVITMLEWAWTYFFSTRGSRLITETVQVGERREEMAEEEDARALAQRSGSTERPAAQPDGHAAPPAQRA